MPFLIPIVIEVAVIRVNPIVIKGNIDEGLLGKAITVTVVTGTKDGMEFH